MTNFGASQQLFPGKATFRVLTLATVAALGGMSGCAPSPVTDAAAVGEVSSSDRSIRTAAPEVDASSTYRMIDFVRAIAGDNEDVWSTVFLSMRMPPYSPPTIVIFSGRVDSACGPVSATVGPYYCPVDRRVFLDTTYLTAPSRHLDAGGFAPAYLIAHEIARHVQNILGTTRQVQDAMTVMQKEGRDPLRVLLQLQADCYAGVWVHSVKERNRLEPGEVDSGLAAALALGNPTTDGDIPRRMQWFQQDLSTGDPRQCAVPGFSISAL